MTTIKTKSRKIKKPRTKRIPIVVKQHNLIKQLESKLQATADKGATFHFTLEEMNLIKDFCYIELFQLMKTLISFPKIII